MDSLKKIANALLGICGASIVIPRLFVMFNSVEGSILDRVPWAYFILGFGVLGILLRIVIAIKQGAHFGINSIVLLLSLFVLFIGFAALEMTLPSSRYILLAGVLLLASWLLIPNSKKQEDDI